MEIAPIVIPDRAIVYVGSDWHGQARAARKVLAQAGLIDAAGAWIAPAGTALVLLGDLIDRGPDSGALVRDLDRLRAEAIGAGSWVVLLEGNHERMARDGLAGDRFQLEMWANNGGTRTTRSLGLTDDWGLNPIPKTLAGDLDAIAPDVRPFLASLAPYARWRDILLVHGGPVPRLDLATFARSIERLWIREGFYAGPTYPEHAVWAAYRAAGLHRVVFGHTPIPNGPGLFHDGQALDIDSGAGSPYLDPAIVSLSLFRLPADDQPLATAQVWRAPLERP